MEKIKDKLKKQSSEAVVINYPPTNNNPPPPAINNNSPRPPNNTSDGRRQLKSVEAYNLEEGKCKTKADMSEWRLLNSVNFALGKSTMHEGKLIISTVCIGRKQRRSQIHKYKCNLYDCIGLGTKFMQFHMLHKHLDSNCYEIRRN